MSNTREIRRFLQTTAAAAAVEFALVVPALILLLFGMVAYATVLMTYSGVQQLAAESARATVGGLSATERDQLARAFVAANVGAYAFLDPTRLTVTTASLAGPPAGFQVTLSYDDSNSIAFATMRVVPLASTPIVRSAVVQQGGS